MTHSVGKQNPNFISSKEDVAIDLDVNMQKKVQPVLSNQLSELNQRYSHEKTDKRCCSFRWFKRRLYRFGRLFVISGEQRVKRQKFESEDFDLPDDQKLANYNASVDSLWRRILQILLLDLYYKLMPVAICYLLWFYILSIYGFNRLLCEEKEDSPTTPSGETTTVNYLGQVVNHEKVPFALSRGLLCDPAQLEHYRVLEHDFTKILTFFIGFFVSLSVNNWFSQIRLVPQLDQILVQINNFLWVDPKKLIDDVKIKDGMTAKQLRNKIVRYFLLSWTICLSRMSVRMNDKFQDEIALNKKGLMSKREFDILNCGTGRDSWREKWSTPLAWVAMMVNDANIVNSIDAKSSKIIDIKDAIGKTLHSYCHDLQKLNSYNEYRIPAPLVQILQFAIWVFFIVSVIAGQDMFLQDETDNFFVKLVCDYIPYLSIWKYLMLWGWLKVAADLSVPFGNGRHCVDLLGFLDFEIWKASHMLAHGIPLEEQDSSNRRDSKNRVWNDIDP